MAWDDNRVDSGDVGSSLDSGTSDSGGGGDDDDDGGQPGLGDVTSGSGGIDSEFGDGSSGSTGGSSDDDDDGGQPGLGDIDSDSGGIDSEFGDEGADGTDDTSTQPQQPSEPSPTQPSSPDGSDSGQSDSGGSSEQDSNRDRQSQPEQDPREDLPDEVGRAGRVEGGFGGLDFGEDGRTVLEETPDDQGFETRADRRGKRATQVEDRFVDRTGMSEEQVRVTEDYQGNLRVRPTEAFEERVESQTAATSAASSSGVEADVDTDFTASTSLNQQGQQQVAEAKASQSPALSADGIAVSEQGQVSLTGQGRQQIANQRAANSALDPTDFEVRDDGTTRLTQSGQRQLERDVASGMAAVGAGQINVTGSGSLTEESRQTIAQSIASQRDFITPGEVEVGPTGEISFTGDAAVRTGQSPEAVRGGGQSQGSQPLLIDQDGFEGGEVSQPTPTQTTQARSSFDRPSLEADDDIEESLTTGGFLAEEGDGFDPAAGEFVPSEEELQSVSREYLQGVGVVSRGAGEVVDEVTTLGDAEFGDDQVESRLGKVTTGATGLLGSAGDVPGFALTGETAVEAGEGALAEGPSQPLETAGTAAALGSETTTRLLRAGSDAVFESPYRTLGGGIGVGATAVAGGVATGKALRTTRRATRGVRDRVRTAGSIDITDETVSDEVLQQFRDGDGDQFPGLDDPDTFAEDEALAIREQANRMTPDDVQQRFEEAGVAGTDLKKALGTEPEGPGAGRAAQGIETPSADSDLADAYETSGTSFGPEFSPNFFNLEDAQSPGFSLRPGLPDSGANKPTGVIARTDVEESRATSTPEFDEELREAAGDTTARTVSSEFEGFDPISEAEVQTPPDAEFADLGGSFSRNVARRFGIGSDYRIEVGGRRVPVRAVAPADDLDTGGVSRRSLLDDDRGQVSSPDVDFRPAARRLDEFGERRQPVDRPLPASPVSGGAPPSSPAISDSVDSPASRPNAPVDSRSGTGFAGDGAGFSGAGSGNSRGQFGSTGGSGGFDPSGGLFDGGRGGGFSDGDGGFGGSGGGGSSPPGGGSQPPSDPVTGGGSSGPPFSPYEPRPTGESGRRFDWPDDDTDFDPTVGSFNQFESQEFDNPVADPSDVIF